MQINTNRWMIDRIGGAFDCSDSRNNRTQSIRRLLNYRTLSEPSFLTSVRIYRVLTIANRYSDINLTETTHAAALVNPIYTPCPVKK